MTRKLLIFLAITLLFCVYGTTAQQQKEKSRDPRLANPIEPYGPLGEQESSSTTRDQTSDPSVQRQPEAAPRPLTGVEDVTLERMGRGRSYFVPYFHFSQTVDTNRSGLTAGQADLSSVSLFNGGISLEREWRNYHLSTHYSGGGTVYNNAQDGLRRSYYFHQAGLTQRIFLRRWQFLIGDYFSYLPESAFGLPGTGLFDPGAIGPGHGLGEGGALLNTSLVPSQSIFTGDSRRISNAAVGQGLYQLTRRSSVTFSGSFGLLHFLDGGFQDGRSTNFSTGYNYLLGPQDTIAVGYTHGRFWFTGSDLTITSHTVHVGYGHQITGRMSLQISGGPDVLLRSALNGLVKDHRLSWSVRSTLNYQFQRSSLYLSYNHFLNGGSGVFSGARTHLVQANWDRQLTRNWGLDMRVAYSRNAELTSAGAGGNVFHSVLGGFSLSRPVGRYTDIFFSYNVQRQQSNFPVCFGGSCGQVMLRHVFGVGFRFGYRPIEIE
jgi:hypothetical protein